MNMKLKKGLLDIITIIISIVALGFSIYSHFKNISLQEKYEMLSTFGMTLNYQVKISDKEGEGKVTFDDTEIHTGQIDIVPKTGGIEKVYAIHYFKDHVKAILPVELYAKETEKYNAQDLFWRLPEYTIDITAQTSDEYYGTMYLVVKDYQNNYYTNMIVYEISKKETPSIKTRTYSEIDLLHVYNENKDALPEFDASQMKEYQNLKRKLGEIL